MEYLSIIIAGAALLFSFYQASKKDTKEGTAEIAKVMAKLDSILEDVQEIKNDRIELKRSIQEDHDRIIRLEVSCDTLQKKINEIGRGYKNEEIFEQ